MKFDVEQINELIKNRRSVFPRQYSEKIIDKEVIDKILENANWAPSHGKTEPWRFFVFEGKAKQKLGEFQSNLYKNVTAPDLFLQAKFEKLKNAPMKASHIVAIGMKRQETEKIPEIEEIEAVACAVQNMHLTATAYGIGGYWASGGATYTDEMKTFLGLGEKDKVLGFFYLGYPNGEIQEGKRGAVEDKVIWV